MKAWVEAGAVKGAYLLCVSVNSCLWVCEFGLKCWERPGTHTAGGTHSAVPATHCTMSLGLSPATGGVQSSPCLMAQCSILGSPSDCNGNPQVLQNEADYVTETQKGRTAQCPESVSCVVFLHTGAHSP